MGSKGGAIAVSFSLAGSDTLGGQGKALKLDLTAGFGLPQGHLQEKMEMQMLLFS